MMIGIALWVVLSTGDTAPANGDAREVGAQHPADEDACRAANLMLETYKLKKDYAALRDAAHAYVEDVDLSCSGEERGRLAKVEEQSAYMFIKTELEERGEWIQAAKEYGGYYTKFPHGDLAGDAISDAARCYDKAGRFDDAIQMREFLVGHMLSADPTVRKETRYELAELYERLADFDMAAKHLEVYAQMYSNDERSRDALQRAALYRAQLGQLEEARRLRQTFVKKYPTAPDCPKVAFAICQSLEDEAVSLEQRVQEERKPGGSGKAILKKWQDSNTCYGQYVVNKTYVAKDPDLVCYAHFRLAESMRLKTHDAKGASMQEALVLDNGRRWRAEETRRRWPNEYVGPEKKERMPRCAEAVAEIELRNLQRDFETYRNIELVKLDIVKNGADALAVASVAKDKARDDLKAKLQVVAELDVATWTFAATFKIGEVYQDYADKLRAAQVNEQVDRATVASHIKARLKDRLKRRIAEAEASAIEAHEYCLRKAQEMGIYSDPWALRARRELERLLPKEYSPVDERVPRVNTADPEAVATNGLVVPDGDSWRSLSFEPPAASIPKTPGLVEGIP